MNTAIQELALWMMSKKAVMKEVGTRPKRGINTMKTTMKNKRKKDQDTQVSQEPQWQIL